MRPSRPSGWGAAVVALAIASLAEARSATMKDGARLRAAPAATADQVGEVPAGTVVEVLGESGGWRRIQTPDGQSGYVWGEYLGDDDDASHHGSMADDVRALRDDVAALRERAGPSAADVDRLRAEIERLATAQQALGRRLDERALAGDGPGEALGVAPLVFVIGAAFGWVVSRLTQRRRDRRQRDRIRL